MKFSRALLALAALLSWASLKTPAQTAAPSAADDGKLLESAAYQFPAYEEIRGWIKNYMTAEHYARIRNAPDLELLKIRYASDGLRVAGFIYKPRRTDGRRLPVVIYNRGSLGPGSEIGPLNFNYLYEMHRLASEGFVVLASQYRGYDGAGGSDEAAGADTNDVLNIVALARTLPYVDSDRMFMWGFSRGAIMAFQAMRRGVALRAAAVVGAPTDYFEFARQPGRERFFRERFPDYDRRKEEHLLNRSVIRWPEKVTAPLLIIHGGSDALPPAQSMALAAKLGEQGTVYELVVYAKDNHPTSLNFEDRVRRTVDWFKNPRTLPVSQPLRKHFAEGGTAEQAVKLYRALRQGDLYDFSEPELNTLGYELLGAGRVAEAVEIFKLNVEAFPEAFNTYDSLAEAYAVRGDKGLAIKNYRRSLELNPQNTNAAEKLKELEGK